MFLITHNSLQAATPNYVHNLTSSIYYTDQSFLQTVLLQIEMPAKMDKEKRTISALQV